MENMKNCKECNKEFEPRKTGGYPQIRCSQRCNDKNYYKKKRTKIIKQKHEYYRKRHPFLPSRLCDFCKISFIPDRTINRFCTRICKNKGRHQENIKYYNKKSKEWFIKNPEYRNSYARNRRKNNISVRLADSLRSRLRQALNGKMKISSARRLLGCTIEELWLHLEKQFQPGMIRENRAFRGWHVDHIIPINLFDLSDPKQQRKAFHYTNLQPLWWRDNLTKPKKYEIK